MVGQRTHDQQQRIIKHEENTKGGGAGFPAEEDLNASKGLRDAKAKSENLAEPAKTFRIPMIGTWCGGATTKAASSITWPY